MKIISFVSAGLSLSAIVIMMACGDIVRTNVDTEAIAQEFCAYTQRCSPAQIPELYGDPNGCVTAVDAELHVTFALAGVTITTAEGNACGAKLTTVGCDVPHEDVAECRFKGTLATGAGCAIDAQCASGYCSSSSTTPGNVDNGNCGQCADVSDVGGACNETEGCKVGLACDFSAQKCVARPVKGDACVPGRVACASGTCLSQVCADPVRAGGACDDGSRDECAAPLVCVGGACTDVTSQLTFSEIGQPCGGVDAATQTIVGCKAASCTGAATAQTCVPFGKEGDSCASTGAGVPPGCEPQLTCGSYGTCTKGDPAACT